MRESSKFRYLNNKTSPDFSGEVLSSFGSPLGWKLELFTYYKSLAFCDVSDVKSALEMA